MAKKHILELEYRHGYETAGLVSVQKDYRICWLINKQLGVDLVRQPDFSYVLTEGDSPLSIPVFYYENPDIYFSMALISNRIDGNVLFAEPKSMDYLLLFKNPGEQYDLPMTIEKIRSIPQVQAAFLLPKRVDKKSSGLFFDFEMYLSQR